LTQPGYDLHGAVYRLVFVVNDGAIPLQLEQWAFIAACQADHFLNRHDTIRGGLTDADTQVLA
jgi:hypothetical protein